MKIYLAGSCSVDQRDTMKGIAKVLRDKEFEVYCPFELKIENAWDYPQEVWAQKVFDADKAAIDECDMFIMITPGRQSTAGTNWEQGYAFAKKKIILVFQLTQDDTSLMTFCGCDKFFNTSYETVGDDIIDALRYPFLEDTVPEQNKGYGALKKCVTRIT